MIRKPQNLQIQGQRTEVNPGINAGPVLGRDAVRGPRRTFEAIDLSQLSNTLARLGRERQNVLLDAENRTGIRVQDMIEQNMEVDQILKELTGSTPKQLLADIEKRIRAGNLDEVDSPAFQMGFQRRRSEYRIRAAGDAIISNEEQMQAWTNTIVNSGLGEDRITAENVIADARQAIAEQTSDLGPYGQEVAGEMLLEFTDRLRADLNGRVRSQRKIVNQQLLENKIGSELDKFYAVAGDSGVFLFDMAIEAAARQSFRNIYGENRGTSADPSKDMGTALLNQMEEFANRFGEGAAKEFLEFAYTIRTEEGAPIFDGRPIGNSMLEQAERFERRAQRNSETRGTNYGELQKEADALTTTIDPLRKRISAALAGNDPSKITEERTAIVKAIEGETEEWVKDVPKDLRPWLVNSVEAKLTQRAGAANAAGGANTRSLVASAGEILSQGGRVGDERVLSRSLSLIDNDPNASEQSKQEARDIITQRWQRRVDQTVDTMNLRPAITRMAARFKGYGDELSPSQEDELRLQVIKMEREVREMLDYIPLGPEADIATLSTEILSDLEKTYKDNRDITGQLDVSEVLGDDATDSEIETVARSIQSAEDEEEPEELPDRLVGGFSRASLKRQVEREGGDNHPVLELDDTVRRLAATREEGSLSVLGSVVGGPSGDAPILRRTMVPELISDLNEALSADMNDKRRAKVVGEAFMTSGAMTPTAYVLAMSNAGAAPSDQLREKVTQDLMTFRGEIPESRTISTMDGSYTVGGDLWTTADEDIGAVLDSGFDVTDVDIFAVKFAGFEDAKSAVTTIFDGDSLAFPRLERVAIPGPGPGAGSTAQTLYMQAERILEARGFEVTEDAILTFVYVQSRLHE